MLAHGRLVTFEAFGNGTVLDYFLACDHCCEFTRPTPCL